MGKSAVVFLLWCSILCSADTTIKTHTVGSDTASPPNVEGDWEHRDVHYRRAAMRRKDSLGRGTTVSLSSIANCETRTGFLVDMEAHQYRTFKVVKFWPKEKLDEYRQKYHAKVVQIDSNTVETGERRTFLGYPARHFITTTRRLDDGKAGGEEISDAWYIEHERADQNCAPDFVRSEPMYTVGTALTKPGTGLTDPPEFSDFHHTGPLPAGLAVKKTLTQKTTDANGKERVITVEETVEELSDSPLNPSIFEVPAGYHENPDLLGGQIHLQH